MESLGDQGIGLGVGLTTCGIGLENTPQPLLGTDTRGPAPDLWH